MNLPYSSLSWTYRASGAYSAQVAQWVQEYLHRRTLVAKEQGLENLESCGQER